MILKECRYVFINDNFALLRVIEMVIDQAIFTNKTLVLPTEFWSNLVRVRVTIHHRYCETLLNLFSNMYVCRKFDRLLKTFGRTVIRVTVRTFELAFDDKLLALTFDHLSFHALTTCCLTTTDQINWLPVFKIELEFAKRTFQHRCIGIFHFDET
jgi:hypothetical protein